MEVCCCAFFSEDYTTLQHIFIFNICLLSHIDVDPSL